MILDHVDHVTSECIYKYINIERYILILILLFVAPEELPDFRRG